MLIEILAIKFDLVNLQEVKHGVPQGSILGPLIYIIYTFNMRNLDENKKVVYSDDTTVMLGIQATSPEGGLIGRVVRLATSKEREEVVRSLRARGGYGPPFIVDCSAASRSPIGRGRSLGSPATGQGRGQVSVIRPRVSPG